MPPSPTHHETTYDRRSSLSEQDVKLLHEIVRLAQENADLLSHPKQALFNAYEAVFAQYGLDSNKDRTCLRVLLQLGAPDVPGESLFDKFDHILEQAGIFVVYDEETEEEEQKEVKELAVADVHTIARKVERRQSFEATERSIRPFRSAASTPTNYVKIDDCVKISSPRKLPPRSNSNPAVSPASTQMTSPTESHGRFHLATHSAGAQPIIHAASSSAQEELELAVLYDTRALLRQAIRIWRYAMQYGDRVDKACAPALKAKGLGVLADAVKERRADLQRADQAHTSSLRTAMLRKWIVATRERLHEYYAAEVFAQQQQDRRTTAEIIYLWVLKEREVLLTRKFQTRIKQEALATLVYSCRVQRDRLTAAEALCKETSKRRLTASTMMSMKRYKKAQMEMVQLAKDFYGSQLKIETLASFKVRTKEHQRQELRANDAREYFLMKRYLQRWRMVARARKKQRLNEAYKKIRKTTALNLVERIIKTWRESMRQTRVQYDHAQALVERKDAAVVQNAFVTWRKENSRHLRQIEQASTGYDEYVMGQALKILIKTFQYHGTLAEQSDQYDQARVTEAAAGAIRQLSMKAFEMKQRERNADAMLDRHFSKHVKNMMRHWLAKCRRRSGLRQKETPSNEITDAGYATGGTALPSAAEEDEDWGPKDQELLQRAMTAATPPGYLQTPSKARTAARAKIMARLAGTPATSFRDKLRQGLEASS